VYALEPVTGERTLLAQDLVVGEDLRDDVDDFLVDTHPITSITSVTILHSVGTAAFESAWGRLEAGLVEIPERSAAPDELPPFTKVPRDAAVVVRFDDLIDPASVSADALQVWTRASSGSAEERYPARVIVDRNHGGWTAPEGSAEARFVPTRVVLDMTTSEVEAMKDGIPSAACAQGLPPNRDPSIANVVVRIPTTGEHAVRNLAGRSLAEDECARVFSSGGDDDPFHGMLVDVQPPRVLGTQSVTIDGAAPDPQGGPNDYLAILTFATPSCARAASTRDVLLTAAAYLVVTRDSGPPANARLARVHLRALVGGPLTTGQGQLRSPFDPVQDQGREACFVRFSPPPLAAPNRGVSPSSQIVLEFSEPMDTASVSAFHDWTITDAPQASAPADYVAGNIAPDVVHSRFVFTPVLPLRHFLGSGENYYSSLASGPDGPKDLAGNPLRDALPQVRFTLNPHEATQQTGNYVLRFQSADEDGNGHPEIRGQFLRDLALGEILPRPVTRFSAVADRTQAVPGRMFPIVPGVQTPLTPLGSKLHSLWRYCDVGMSLLDESLTNLDVEGLDWSPGAGSVTADHYTRFEISLAHAGRLPDEIVNVTTLLPAYPQSGIGATFDQNQLDAVHDPLQVVHPRARGYTIDPNDRFTSTTGTPMMPWPLNRGLPPDQHRFYTWRDTALQALGGLGGAGAELAIVVQTTGQGTPGVPYLTDQVPTIGMPLLMEFKCFPDAAATGTNALDISIAINSSSRPNFRAFSAGGVNASGQTIVVDPDLAAVASGGFNPNSNPPGAPTLPVDNVFFIGQMDLVVRVSRLHSVWIDTHSANTTFAPPVVEPAAANLPAGTQVVLAFRGATVVTQNLVENADALDAYGEPLQGALTYFHNDASWKSSIAALNGARLVQLRASFVSNAATNLGPRMSGLGLAFYNP
jgi:hypothetical protein